jgi:hypothetical protein
VKESIRTPKWLFYALGSVILCALVIGVFDFIHRWHVRGDAFAQAEGNLLTFIAAGCSVLVTLIYIFYTRRSLETAEAAIQLQREQWDHIVRVKPQIRLIEGIDGRLWYVENSEKGQNELIGRFPEITCVIWNHGQQSLFVEEIRVSREDWDNARILVEDSCKMLKPHTEETFDISRAVGELLAPLADPRSNVLRALPDIKTKLNLVVHYTDWLRQSQGSKPLYFELEFTQTVSKEDMFKINICN